MRQLLASEAATREIGVEAQNKVQGCTMRASILSFWMRKDASILKTL
jgi:hypothetical protein